MIYGVTFLRLLPGTALAVEVVGAQEDLDVVPEGSEILQLGGEGRRAVVTRLPNPVTRARDRRRTVESAARPGRTRSGSRHERSRLRQGAEPGPRADGRLVLLTTPGLFNGWKPPKLTVRAAAVPDPVPVSGWDLALRGPKATRFAVPAGSVYFLDHGAEVDSLTSGSRASSEDAAAGWGSFESGEWNHA